MFFIPEPLHPAVVHFPIALTFAALLFELLACLPRLRSLEKAAVLLVALAAVGGVVAFVTGRWAHDEAVVPAAARQLLEQHEDLGLWVMLGLGLLAGVRVGLVDPRYPALRWGYVVVLAALASMVAYQGWLGGRLVYEHGVGVAPGLGAPS